MALTLADGTPSALVLDFVLALVLESVLELDGRSATYTNEMAHQGRSDVLSTALRGNQIACSAIWEGSDAQYGAQRQSDCMLGHLGRVVDPGWQRQPGDDPMQALTMPRR